MLGALIGDMVGSTYEFHPTKRTDFKLFTPFSKFTDDTVCTLAVAEAVMHHKDYELALLHWCRRYPDAGYGKTFKAWFMSDDPKPGDSFGNGSAMRVSPVAYSECQETDLLREAAASAYPTHSHPEGIKGAQAVAYAVWVNKCVHGGYCKDKLRQELETRFGYDLSTPLDMIRKKYKMDATCQGSVPQAIRAFLESTDFESAIRLAISLGGDADTQASIAGAIAEAHYRKIPKMMVVETFKRLPSHFVDAILRFQKVYGITLLV